MAEQLAFSRAALYRHISKLNEKTNTKGRVGLFAILSPVGNGEVGREGMLLISGAPFMHSNRQIFMRDRKKSIGMHE